MSFYETSFFPTSLEEGFHLDPSTRNLETINVFKKIYILSFILPFENSIFNIFDPEGLKLFISLRLGFSHLNEHCFRHNFQECLNPLCTCSLEIENTSHYLLHCHHNTPLRADLTNSKKTFVVDFESLSDSIKVEILLYGDSWCIDNQNNSILSASIKNIKKTKRFDCFLFD